MSEYVGIIRDGEGLRHAKNLVEKYHEMLVNMKNTTPEDWELQNIVMLSGLVIESALKREESRGAHYRSDFSKTDDEKWKTHIVVKKG